ncbi:hypothetical protein F5Y15DRAFT_25088 [Xylariaceae sp. FL0016]|nr:hypothetical protein F5Y15DRAFT_25088 [Xylariaceae sp. FL0016]
MKKTSTKMLSSSDAPAGVADPSHRPRARGPRAMSISAESPAGGGGGGLASPLQAVSRNAGGSPTKASSAFVSKMPQKGGSPMRKPREAAGAPVAAPEIEASAMADVPDMRPQEEVRPKRISLLRGHTWQERAEQRDLEDPVKPRDVAPRTEAMVTPEVIPPVAPLQTAPPSASDRETWMTAPSPRHLRRPTETSIASPSPSAARASAINTIPPPPTTTTMTAGYARSPAASSSPTKAPKPAPVNLMSAMRGLDGAELREVVLHECLLSSTSRQQVVRQLAAIHETKVYTHGRPGCGADYVGLHLQYLSPGELEGVIVKLCHMDRSGAVKGEVLEMMRCIGERKELVRDVY